MRIQTTPECEVKLASYPEDVQSRVEALRQLVLDIATDAGD